MKTLTLFEPLFQELRIRKVIHQIPRGGTLLDVGCDQPQVLIDRVRDELKLCIGIDSEVIPHNYANVRILQEKIQHKISVPSNSLNVITMLAVLEHLKHPADIVEECYRILKKDGVLLVTVPSPNSRPLLELFAVLGLVRKKMIEQHENYFTRNQLMTLCKQVGFRNVQVEHFELRCNTFVKAVK
jgi:2-polyprenyl-3-methyl-5-hydroxy-6-metoxy-1,4-benzoquinol methylase